MIANRELLLLSMTSLALNEVQANQGLPESSTDFIDLVVQYGRRAQITRDEVSVFLNQPLQALVDTMTNKDKGNGQ
ncbi:hypothetical protein ACEUAI_21095 [Aeromonas veronii]